MNMAWRLMHIPAMAADYADLAKKTGSGINWTGKVTCLEKRLIEPLLIKKPCTFFVNSMSDLFHPEIPFEFISKVFAIMALTPQHTYQVLTKQPKRALEYFEKYDNGLPDSKEMDIFILNNYEEQIFVIDKSKEFGNLPTTTLLPHLVKAGWYFDSFLTEWGKETELIFEHKGPLKNVWIGVSVENDDYLHRVDELTHIPAAVRFVSYEPALGPIDISKHLVPIGVHHHPDNVLTGEIGMALNRMVKMVNSDLKSRIDWVICGGESGIGKDVQPMHPDWACSIRDQCKSAGVAFFFKQWGKYLPKCQSEGMDITGYKITRFQSPNNPAKMNEYYNMGKHNAGCKLDGIEYKEMPV